MKTLAKVLALLLVMSCSRKITPLIVEQERVVTVKHSDTVTRIDSSAIHALLRCDSLGNVYLIEISQLQGTVSSLALQLHDNELHVMGSAMTVGSETVTSQSDAVIKYIPVEVEKKLTARQQLQMAIGRIVMWTIPILIIGWGIFLFLRYNFKGISSTFKHFKKL